MDLYISASGTITCIYTEAISLPALGHAQIRRASLLEPDGDGLWWADLAPVKGPRLGPFETRGQALAAEQEWLSQFLEMHFSSSMQPLS